VTGSHSHSHSHSHFHFHASIPIRTRTRTRTRTQAHPHKQHFPNANPINLSLQTDHVRGHVWSYFHQPSIRLDLCLCLCFRLRFSQLRRSVCFTKPSLNPTITRTPILTRTRTLILPIIVILITANPSTLPLISTCHECNQHASLSGTITGWEWEQ